MDDSLLPVTSLRENLIQAYLDFSYFRTTEPKLLRLCARRHSQAYETPFGWATHVSTNQHLSQQNSVGSILRNNQLQYRNILSVSILAKISPSGRHTMIRIAEANQEADTSKDMMPRL